MDNDNRSSSEIADRISELEAKLRGMISDHEVVEQERLDLQRQILELQLKKKKLEATISQSKSNMNLLKIDIKLETSRFWATKNAGL